MMRKMKKVLALALALVLALSLGVSPVGVSAESDTGYIDVDANASYAEAVALLTEADIMNGIGGNKFGPGRSVMRAEAITVLGRLAGAEQVETDDFDDVEPNSWYSGYVGWAVENGIVEGDGKGNFLPYANVTSEHLNLMLSRYAEMIGEKYTFYDTGADTVARADLAQRLVVFLTGEPGSAVAEVEVTGGTIRGYVDSNGVSTYKGIPYAASTEGENRWRDPQPVEPWEGVRMAIDYGPIVLQNEPVVFLPWTAEYIDVGFNITNGKMSEDSLNLNVWTTGEPGDDMPVLVYIHGGANTSGSGANEVYSGEMIAQKGVVYVSINYRVATFGFLAAKDETGEATGNFAYKDQIAALKWVQENIETFGGDPSNVTIAGQSAGSSNVQTLIASPAAAGLFSKAIAMGGNSYNPDATLRTMEEAQAASATTLEELGYTLAELRAMSTEEIYEIMGDLPRSGAVNDGEYVTQTLAEAYASGDYNQVDMIYGGVTGDNAMLGGAVTEEQVQNMMTRYYTAASAKNTGDPSHKTFIYYFSHPVPDADPELQEYYGAFHTGELAYWLNHYSDLSNRPWTDVDYALGGAMSDYLVNFLTTGDPNGTDSNGEALPVWMDVASTDSVFSYMEFGDTPHYVGIEMNPQATVTGGVIEGYVDANGVSTYKGIPYAASTAGENRWRDPQPVEPWEGVKKTVDYGAIPLQSEPVVFLPWTAEYIDVGFTLENGLISEESLNLNVWTTGEPGDDLPVLVYIHGGANTTGSGSNEVYTGEHLAQKGIVYVSINYRVHTFGFLAAKDETGEATGNFAYKDQIAALKWVQENIATFGGDPSNVTIAGQSAGASNVQTLIASPAAEGLFNKAVVMSGNSWRADASPLTTLEEAQEKSATTLEELGYTLAELRAMSTEEVYAIMSSLPRSGAVNDGEYVTQNISEAYAGGDYNHVDMLIGNVSGDGGGNLESNMLRNYQAATAKNEGDPTHKTYTYGFTRIVPDADPELQEKHGAFHTGDVGYWMNHFSTTSNRPWTDTDYELGEIMSSYLVNFVTTGDPNGTDSYGNPLPEWKDVASTDTTSYMELGDTVQFVEE